MDVEIRLSANQLELEVVGKHFAICNDLKLQHEMRDLEFKTRAESENWMRYLLAESAYRHAVEVDQETIAISFVRSMIVRIKQFERTGATITLKTPIRYNRNTMSIVGVLGQVALPRVTFYTLTGRVTLIAPERDAISEIFSAWHSNALLYIEGDEIRAVFDCNATDRILSYGVSSIHSDDYSIADDGEEF